MDATLLDYAIVAALGALVGSGELVSRYRDAPAGALRTWPALFYTLINMAASIVALFVIHVFHWHFGVISGDAPVRWTQVGIAGTGPWRFSVAHSSLCTSATATSP